MAAVLRPTRHAGQAAQRAPALPAPSRPVALPGRGAGQAAHDSEDKPHPWYSSHRSGLLDRMRVAAIGDAHLGRSYYPFTTESGVNQREFDFEQSFEAAVDLALAQDPDLVIWLGDVFDHPRPTYRSFRVAQRALARIRDHGVPAVVISGNHDTPRLPGTGSPYSALADSFPEMHFAHRLAYERFELPGLVVHAVPADAHGRSRPGGPRRSGPAAQRRRRPICSSPTPA